MSATKGIYAKEDPHPNERHSIASTLPPNLLLLIQRKSGENPFASKSHAVKSVIMTTEKIGVRIWAAYRCSLSPS